MLDVYKKVLALFDARERRRFYLVLAILVVAAGFELVSISSILILLGILAQPEQVETSLILHGLYTQLGFSSIFKFQIFLSLLTFTLIILSLIARGGAVYAITRFSTMRGYMLSRRMLNGYLRRPYEWFLGQHSAEIGRTVIGEVERLINQVVIPGMRIMAGVITASLILIFLVQVDPMMVAVAAPILGGFYGLIYWILKPVLTKIGRDMITSSEERNHLAHEAIGGFKELKINSLDNSFADRFDGPARRFAVQTGRLQIIYELPRFLLEGLTVGVMLMVVLFMLLRNSGSLTAIIPTLGAFAFAVIRLLPALQQIYSGVASIRAGLPLLSRIHHDFIVNQEYIAASGRDAAKVTPLPFERSLELRGVSYKYTTAEKAIFDNLNLTIEACTTIGIVGGTGAGKTTLVDLILGLLTPDQGVILVDGIAIDQQNVRAWQRSIGYVPQTIYLTDDTIAANIAFGRARDEIDHTAVERAARVAALHDFVMSELPEGYQTKVGERGVRLSGGQRQRIGIARALYGNPSLLIMDEATSALDNITERMVMDAVQNIRADKTIIMIAHRLTTVKNCDVIIMLERGCVASTGTYDELVAENDTFRRMAEST
jgi:ABC-type multidrug transport system fused ATPase/permease subunit